MEDKIIERTSVSVLILAIFFGILQYIPQDKTYNFFTIETGLKVMAMSFFNIVLLLFLIYFILIAINLGYGLEETIPKKYLKGLYNSAVLTTFLIIFWIISFGLLISLIPPLSAKLVGYLFLIVLIFGAICFSILFRRYVF